MHTQEFALRSLAADQSASRLESGCGRLARLTEQMAIQTIRSPHYEVKLAIAGGLADLIILLDELWDRLAFFGPTAALSTLRRAPREWVEEQNWSDWRAENCTLSSSASLLANAMKAHASELHGIWDRDTRSALDRAATSLHSFVEQLASSTRLVDSLALDEAATFSFASTHPHRVQRYSPTRDGRFYPVDKVAGMPDLDINTIVLMGTEIPTIEHCCSMYVDFPDMPPEFHVDVAYQMADEVRHAFGFMERFNWLGIEVRHFPVDFDLWSATTEQPLELRLAIHQRVGEWAGVAAQEAYVERLIADSPDPAFARFLKYVTLDEIQHVAYGNKWLRHLAKDDDEVWKIDARARAIRGTPPLPYPGWAAQMAGFRHEDAERLRAATTGVLVEGMRS